MDKLVLNLFVLFQIRKHFIQAAIFFCLITLRSKTTSDGHIPPDFPLLRDKTLTYPQESTAEVKEA